ncbi:MAG: WYL domain-containing protein [Deltaproteobacteria bacterium]|nr:WYL domain-containing protein [Deltaproteobacteria bacterium]TLN01120.1 MAG: WYL domain-containing protein [bacterium]
MKDQSVTIPWSTQKRLQFLEFKLYWEGRVNRGDLTAEFGISIPQASVDFTKYQEIAPKNISYNSSAKYYEPTETFSPIFIELSADAYFSTILCSPTESIATCGSDYVAAVPNPSRAIDLDVLRTLVQSIKNKQVVSVDYRSFNNPQPGNTRMVSPHAFGTDGLRWHVRAYCHESNSFKDFVLGRIASAVMGSESNIDVNSDHKWFNYAEVVIGPNPKLNEAQKNIVAMDYGMTDFELKIKCRVALLYYLMKKIGIDRNGSDRAGEEQQIVTVNFDEIQAAIRQ